MTGFILAAGYGTRFLPITAHIPKALVSVAGKPLLSRALNFLKSHGFETIGVNSHYLSAQIEQFRDSSSIPFEIFHEEKIRGTGGALFFAREFLSQDDIFFVLNVDIVCQFDLNPAIQFFKDSSFSCLLIAFRPSHGNGTIVYDLESRTYLGTTSEEGSFPTSAEFIALPIKKRVPVSINR